MSFRPDFKNKIRLPITPAANPNGQIIVTIVKKKISSRLLEIPLEKLCIRIVTGINIALAAVRARNLRNIPDKSRLKTIINRLSPREKNITRRIMLSVAERFNTSGVIKSNITGMDTKIKAI